ncbi:hypothetical protein M378DRAFT_648893 [Amanita muscaria Koide BX008]|uniref:Uncharacterized protein n=1 Tax=Amanita muscaria (strain Koide BX008) TaxID=946122 RepID=A0A0C2TB76_AMAMK|nr:hypothetical protein M378DRAFT_648893 [Amanita muscaria Koide BX008]
MSYFLPHLPLAHVDEVIKSEEDRAVVIRVGHQQCMVMDETLYSIAFAEKVQNFPLSTLSISRMCLTSTRCTSCMILAPLCSSIGTSI